MTYETEIKTLRQFVKWANRKGAKYPLPGCPVNYDDITSASKVACLVMDSVMDFNDLNVLIQYAEQGARSLSLRPDRISAIKKAHKALRKAEKCQGTESQQTTQPV